MLFDLAKSFDSALLLSHCCYSIMCKSKYFCYLYISENDTPDNLQNVAPSDGERLWRKVVQAPKVSPAAGGAPTAVADRETGGRGVTRHKAGVAGGSRASGRNNAAGQSSKNGKLPVRSHTGRHRRRIFAAFNIYNYKNDIPIEEDDKMKTNKILIILLLTAAMAFCGALAACQPQEEQFTVTFISEGEQFHSYTEE